MKKSFLFSALLAALLLTGCSESAETAMQQPQTSGGATAVLGKTPVGFSAYQERNVTRGGLVGLLETDSIRKPVSEGGGFGVFAYYTDLKKYDQTYIPNFMYNQLVYDANEGNGTANWTYSPLLYWPNEYGSDAQSDDEDKVSFFAYAPYVATTSAAAGSVDKAEWGITGFSRNTTAGDPIVKYIASFDPSKTVDLCWGVCNQSSWDKIEGNASQTMSVGLPWLNVEHPKAINQKMTFTFKHALAQLNVQIDADPDVSVHSTENTVDASTKVYVRSISFTGIAMQGALNLNNSMSNQATWLDYSGSTDLPYGQSVTVKDGRRDGREGTSGAEANNELPKGLNSQIVQSTTWDDANATPGVTHELQNLFQPQTVIPSDPNDAGYAAAVAKALVEPVYVIPTGETMTVTIVYDIETASENLSSYLSDGVKHGVSIENRISQTVEFNGGGLESGKKYTLMLHLGMNSVKFDATVSGWDSGSSSNAWLPSNKGVGEYNVNNPLTFSLVNGVASTLTGAQATTMTITGLQTGDPAVDNIAQMSAANPSEWTVTTNTDPKSSPVVQIASADGAGTRAGENWANSLTNTTKIKIKPLRAGTATITATDHSGNASSCVVTVDAPLVLLDLTNLSTMYKFNDAATATEKRTVQATLKAAEGAVIADQLSSVSVVTKTYSSYKNATGTELNTAETYSETQGAAAGFCDKVVTAEMDANGLVTVTPVGIGTATVTVSSQTGATASFNVTVNAPNINISTSALTMVKGDKKNLTYTAAPIEDDNYTVSAVSDHPEIATYDPSTGKVTAVAEGTATITFNYTGHTGTHDEVKTCVVTVVATPPTAMKVGDGVIKTNPLWQVAQYNVGKPSFEADGKPKASSFAMQTYHSTTGQYLFNWVCATDTINAMACAAGGSLADYHLPTWADMVKIFPTISSGNGNVLDIFQMESNSFYGYPNSQTISFGTLAADESAFLAATGTGYFYTKNLQEAYAVRIFGDVVTAWHYKYVTYNGMKGLKIESYVLDVEASEIADLEAAKVILVALFDAAEWEKAYNESPDSEEANTSLVMRFFPACGRTYSSPNGDKTVGSGISAYAANVDGRYWSAAPTTIAGNSYALFFNGSHMGFQGTQNGFGTSVRLFRDAE